eukprot:CAMPEP_0115109064 /NCGR_PEP_ID=MMETSP0227-20121206/38420_1 /TAXON_ID=89957 /ORGANISM="Polarella glacialis, Strain CCMP 1383" /LENGTH=49 /DNA_ID= /DNA_START= /DNA_END= /DNA_ORIENTATION=
MIGAVKVPRRTDAASIRHRVVAGSRQGAETQQVQPTPKNAVVVVVVVVV